MTNRIFDFLLGIFLILYGINWIKKSKDKRDKIAMLIGVSSILCGIFLVLVVHYFSPKGSIFRLF